MQIQKRNGQIVDFDLNKIITAITKAMKETDEGVDEDIATHIAQIIKLALQENKIARTVEDIQDAVEHSLMIMRPDVAKKYILYREKRRKLREQGWTMDELQKDIWNNKYRYNNETFMEWLDRVTAGNDKIRKAILNKDFLFAGRILANRGLYLKGKKITYSNCYVTKAPEDNIESILETAKEMARTYSYGGGCGVSLRKLRPRGAKVNNSAQYTTGAVSFMSLYDVVTDIIGQKGRRAALMIELPINHPDIEEFINVKNNTDKITKANISVRMYDNFMLHYKNNIPYPTTFDVETTGERIYKYLNPKALLHQIAENNWRYAEPGVLFWDRISNWNMMSEIEDFEYESVNPCAEEPLPKHGNCLLASINLSNFVKHPYKNNATIDIERLKYVVEQAVIAMNEVLDEGIPLHPLYEQRKTVKDYRPIGLGVMGFADMLIKLGVKYGSKDSFNIADIIGRAILNQAVKTSALLAKEHGTFPKYSTKVLDSKFVQENLFDDTIELIKQYGLRNCQVLSIAPTGSISTMIGVSGGIEPLFAKSYTRTTKSLHDKDVTYKVYPKVIQELMEAKGITNEKDLPDYVVTAHDIHWSYRLKMQSVWQNFIDASISSTINLPNSTTVEDIEQILIHAWKLGLKGVTIYRDGCEREGILKTNETKQENSSKCPECNSTLEHKEGCIACPNCGWGKCSI